MTLNPLCTPGTVVPDVAVPFALPLYVAICGCGWHEGGFDSKTKAKAAQRAHRFPPLPEQDPS